MSKTRNKSNKVASDAKLQTLLKELNWAYGTYLIYGRERYDEALARFKKLAPRYRGSPPWMRPLPARIVKHLPALENGKKRTDISSDEIRLLKQLSPDHHVLKLYDKWSKKRSQRWHQIAKKRDRISRQCGLDRAERKQNQLYDACYVVYDKIIKSPARTVDGLKVKIEAIKIMETGLTKGDNFSSEWESIRTDVDQIKSHCSAARVLQVATGMLMDTI